MKLNFTHWKYAMTTQLFQTTN